MKVFSILSKKTKISLFLGATFAISIVAAIVGQGSSGQPNDAMWKTVPENSLDQNVRRPVVPLIYRTVRLDTAAMARSLASAPMEFTRHASQNPIITLPMPDGTQARFRFEESPVVEAELAAKYPELKTYRAQGVDDPTATCRFDWLPSGFHAIILSPAGTVLVDPYAFGNTTNYITYWKKDAANLAGKFECGVKDSDMPDLPPGVVPNVTSGTQLRTYRLALACTVEYANAVGGGTVAGALAAEVLIMNRVNGVYERDVAIHMNIIANNNLITYAADNLSCGGPCTAANDPYTNDDGGTMLGENVTNLNRRHRRPELRYRPRLQHWRWRHRPARCSLRRKQGSGRNWINKPGRRSVCDRLCRPRNGSPVGREPHLQRHLRQLRWRQSLRRFRL